MNLSRTYRYRIYPTAEQVARLGEWSDALRSLWNVALEQRLQGLNRFGGECHYYTAFDQINELTQLRADLPWLADVPRNVCADLLTQLDLAWKRCFKKLAGQPHFKCKGRDYVNVKEPHHKLFRIESGAVVFPKLGRLRIVLHRPLEGEQKTCAIVRDGDQWFANITVEQEIADPASRVGPVVAIDRGIVNLLADSDGNTVPNPKHAEHVEHQLRRVQRTVSRRKKGSKNREKAKLHAARIQRKVRRRRDHLLHEQSRRYANSHGVIVLEDLGVQRMMSSAKGTIEQPGKNVRAKAGLNRVIAGAGWSKFDGYCQYKLEPLGGHVEKVPAPYSSQTCCKCWHVAAENRQSQSVFVCVKCGHTENADVNAAKVLLSRRTIGGVVCGGMLQAGHPLKQKLKAARS